MAKKNGFTFKQFHVEHDRCGMKVGTDSIILGSWLASEKRQHILDIGTGSGLLALMMAQHNAPRCNIVAVDIMQAAVEQAQHNVDSSPWSSIITVKQQNVVDMVPLSPTQPLFDLIVSNPPYFEAGQTFDTARQVARHTQTLTHQDLLMAVDAMLTDEGIFACVLPYEIALGVIEQAASHGLWPKRQLLVHTKEDELPHRMCVIFSRYSSTTEVDKLIVYTTNLRYSEGYKALCKAFYLNF